MLQYMSLSLLLLNLLTTSGLSILRHGHYITPRQNITWSNLIMLYGSIKSAKQQLQMRSLTHSYTGHIQIFRTLSYFCSWAGWFKS